MGPYFGAVLHCVRCGWKEEPSGKWDSWTELSVDGCSRCDPDGAHRRRNQVVDIADRLEPGWLKKDLERTAVTVCAGLSPSPLGPRTSQDFDEYSNAEIAAAVKLLEKRIAVLRGELAMREEYTGQ